MYIMLSAKLSEHELSLLPTTCIHKMSTHACIVVHIHVHVNVGKDSQTKSCLLMHARTFAFYRPTVPTHYTHTLTTFWVCCGCPWGQRPGTRPRRHRTGHWAQGRREKGMLEEGQTKGGGRGKDIHCEDGYNIWSQIFLGTTCVKLKTPLQCAMHVQLQLQLAEVSLDRCKDIIQPWLTNWTEVWLPGLKLKLNICTLLRSTRSAQS